MRLLLSVLADKVKVRARRRGRYGTTNSTSPNGVGATKMAEKEVLVLRMLMDNIRGLYGSELVHKSGGELGRGTVYTLLERLVQKGYVREVEDPPTAALQLK